MGGPIWTHPTVNEEFLASVLGEMDGNKEKYGHHKRMIGKLKNLSGEVFPFSFGYFLLIYLLLSLFSNLKSL